MNLGGLAVDGSFYEKPRLNITNMTAYDLLSKSGKPQRTDPEIHMSVEFIPAGLLIIQVTEGKNMRKTEWFGKSDNYVVVKSCTTLGQTDAFEKSGRVVKGGGTDCEFGDEFAINVCHHKRINVEVWDSDALGKDDLIGKVEIDLSPVFRFGVLDMWHQLVIPRPAGGCLRSKAKEEATSTAGELHVVLTFFGDDGIKYPAMIGKEDEVSAAKFELKHKEETKQLREKFDKAKETARLEMLADTDEFLLLRARRHEEEEKALKAEFDKIKEAKLAELTALYERDVEEGKADFEMMSPLEQEEFEADGKKRFEQRKNDACNDIEAEHKKRFDAVVDLRSSEEDRGASNKVLIDQRMIELEGEFDLESSKLLETQKMEISGYQYDETERINRPKKREERSLAEVKSALAKEAEETDVKSVFSESSSLASFQRGPQSNALTLPALSTVPALPTLKELGEVEQPPPLLDEVRYGRCHCLCPCRCLCADTTTTPASFSCSFILLLLTPLSPFASLARRAARLPNELT